MICDGEGVDIRTFVEREDKPFIVRGKLDAFTIMMPRLQGHVLDIIYNILKMGVSSGSKTMSRVLSTSGSVDLDYLTTVIKMSKEGQEEEEKSVDPVKEKATNAMEGMTVEPAEEKMASLDELLAGYAEDLSLPSEDELQHAVSAKLA